MVESLPGEERAIEGAFEGDHAQGLAFRNAALRCAEEEALRAVGEDDLEIWDVGAGVIDSGLLETAGEVEGEGVRMRGRGVIIRRALLGEGVARERAELPQGVVRLGEAAGELLDVARLVVERGCGDVGVSGVRRAARRDRCGAGIAGLRDAIRRDVGNGAILGVFCHLGWVVGCLAGREADDAVA